MTARIITLQYRKIIDVNAIKQWDKLVFEDSFVEFKMQAQNFNRGTPFSSYAELIRNIPHAERLTGLVTPSITGYVQQLDSIVPDILNNIGRRFLKFNQFKFELINSDMNDKSKHQVGINFYSNLIWHETVGNYLLVSNYHHGPDAQLKPQDNELLTHLFQLQPYLNICAIKNSI
ncbi:hypothetical protein [Mucilaginibacter arboris]|uniref:Uncharacterized protein n=1 Tax=Mucilaginibacter arboris TaxID=2682090 RepID=A0A7K1T0G7_9SPHI|nr:hypothetical protein [Mucilaginibacter arboris]MVN23055.1 hypothetical protein [Mucilaginibacter arboris]